MSRQIVEVSDLHQLNAVLPHLREPTRFVLANPRRGGPALSLVRLVLAPRGRLRFSGTAAKIFADIDPGPSEPRLIALDTIARSDAEGLERAILSALPHVDQIYIGVDARSDKETFDVADAYADMALPFSNQDIGLDEQAWIDNKIHFANARNFIRERVQAPWALVVDTDEYVVSSDAQLDLRNVVRRRLRDAGSFGVLVKVDGFEHRDVHRLAFTEYRWEQATHNQLRLLHPTDMAPIPGFAIVQDLSLRTEAELQRRTAQRASGVEEMQLDADAGDLNALFHIAKHRIGDPDSDLETAVKICQDYRFRAEVHGPLTDERAWLAMAAAWRYYRLGNFEQAELWAMRVLLDGPRVEAFCLLGDLAEDAGDLHRAHDWYICANMVEPVGQRICWPMITSLRVGRLAGIKLALANPELVAQRDEQTGAEGEHTQGDPDSVAGA